VTSGILLVLEDITKPLTSTAPDRTDLPEVPASGPALG
jgi:hypothetical protein